MLCLLLGFLIAIPSNALASPSPLERAAIASSTNGPGDALIPPSFKLKSSNGFTIEVLALRGAVGSTTAFAIVVVRNRTSSVSYSTEASATEDSIEVNLGDFGHMDVSFHATGGTRAERPTCNKRHALNVENGYYEGTIDFHGEEGYTEVEASRAEGDTSLLFELLCAGNGESGRGPGLPGAELQVRGPRKSSTLPSVTAVENDPRARVQLEASAGEQHGEIWIQRRIRIDAPRTALDYDRKLRSAVLAPPAPFSGEARFQHMGPHRSRWSGDLTVDLPGRSGVPLTGGKLGASLFRARFKGSGLLD